MSSEVTHEKRKLPLVKLAIIAAVLGIAVIAVLLRGGNLGQLVQQSVAIIDQVIAVIRAMGPLVFFLGMAVLPAFGAPLSFFSVAAGEAFAPQLTMPGVVCAAMAAIALNQALTYWLARYALRPVLQKLIARWHYEVPRITKDNALTVTIIVRNTPGPPYFMQGYLLGIGEVPFRLYMLVSWISVLPWTIGFIVLGKAAREGNFGKIIGAVVVIVLAIVVVQVMRRRVAKRET